jgi:hypothetical protein
MKNYAKWRNSELDIDLVSLKLLKVKGKKVKKGLHCIFMQWPEEILKH